MRGNDSELFQDKIEVSLDGRQIFYLFFGGAVIASLVFVLGVMVGKRLESRSHVAVAADTSAALDPLAALDQLDAEDRDDELVFRAALTGDPEARSRAQIRADRTLVARVEPAKQAAAVESVVADDKPSRPEPAPSPEPAAPQPEPEPEPAAPQPEPEPAAPQPEPEPAAPQPEPEPAAPQPEPNPEPELAAPQPEPTPAAKTSRPKFTLQLSSFQDRNEAEAFHSRLTAAGYKPYIVEADVPDKGGIWYRVRLGRYITHTDALAAKAEFEQDQKIIAYVTRW